MSARGCSTPCGRRRSAAARPQRYDAAKGEFVLQPTAQRYESGTQNDALFYSLGTALAFVETIGVDRIARRCRPIAERFYHGLGEIPGVERLSPEAESYRTLMIGFRMKTHTHTAIMEHLAKDKIKARPFPFYHGHIAR